MPASDNLLLHEDILLLALRDDKGTIASGSMYSYALGGALLAELMLDGNLALMGDGKKQKVVVTSDRLRGEPVLDECLERVRDDKKSRAAKDWVMKFANLKDLKHRVAEPLVRRGILREEDAKILLVFNTKKYPEADPRPERRLIERMRLAIFTDTRDVSPRLVSLISLAHHTNLLKNVFEKRELKDREERLKTLSEGSVCGDASKAAVEAVQAAVMVAVMVPTITAST